MTVTFGIDRAAIERALVRWVEDMTELRCIWAGEDARQPDVPYIALQWLSAPSRLGAQQDESYHEADTDEGTVTRTLWGPRTATVTVHAFSDAGGASERAVDYAALLQTLIADATARAKYFDAAGIGIGEVAKIVDSSAVGAGVFSHASFDVDLNLASTVARLSTEPYATSVSVDSTGDVAPQGSTGALLVEE